MLRWLSGRAEDVEIRPPRDQSPIRGAALEDLSITDHGQGLSSGTEEVLLRIPGAIVRLIDGKESVKISGGVFSLTRLSRDGSAIAVFVSVGEDLRWPITKDESATKLDGHHYQFTLKVPQEVEEAKSEGFESKNDPKILKYGVTFRTDCLDESLAKELDVYLRHYCSFTVPKGQRNEWVNSAAERAHLSSLHNKSTSADENSSAYWTTVAPSVEEYNSSIAKKIANQSGNMIDGVLWCSNTTIDKLQSGGDYVKSRVKKKEKPTHISPRTMKNIRRVRKVSRMTDRVAKGVLAGIVTASGVLSGSVVKSRGGRELFKLVPGEVALASLDAFGKVFDAVELAGKGVLNSTSVVTSGVVTHRYGEEAGEASREGMAAVGHWLSTAWTVSKIRKALSKPKSITSKRAAVSQLLGGAAATKNSTSKRF